MLSRSIFRAVCALIVGLLLVSNPTEMTVLLVQVIGGLFAVSGLIAIIGFFTIQAKQSGFRPVFPVVGIGSLAFGAFLLLWPDALVNILMYALGVLLALVGVGQIINLISYRKFAPLTWSLFVIPLLIAAAGILIICYPIESASIPFTILGVAYIIYGVGEFLLGVRFYRFRRLSESSAANHVGTLSDADAVEITDVEDGVTA